MSFFSPEYHYSYLADVALSPSTFLPPTIHLRSFGIQRIPKFENFYAGVPGLFCRLLYILLFNSDEYLDQVQIQLGWDAL